MHAFAEANGKSTCETSQSSPRSEVVQPPSPAWNSKQMAAMDALDATENEVLKCKYFGTLQDGNAIVDDSS